MSRPANLRRELGMSRHWLSTDLAALDPRTDPVAYVLDGRVPAGRAICDALGLDGRFVETGWHPRASLVDALRKASPLEATALERAPATDVGRWTTLLADETARVVVESLPDLAALVAAPPLAGCVVGLERCIDGGAHEWDAERVGDRCPLRP